MCLKTELLSKNEYINKLNLKLDSQLIQSNVKLELDFIKHNFNELNSKIKCSDSEINKSILLVASITNSEQQYLELINQLKLDNWELENDKLK